MTIWKRILLNRKNLIQPRHFFFNFFINMELVILSIWVIYDFKFCIKQISYNLANRHMYVQRNDKMSSISDTGDNNYIDLLPITSPLRSVIIKNAENYCLFMLYNVSISWWLTYVRTRWRFVVLRSLCSMCVCECVWFKARSANVN